MAWQDSLASLPRPESLMGAKTVQQLARALVQLLNNWYLFLTQRNIPQAVFGANAPPFDTVSPITVRGTNAGYYLADRAGGNNYWAVYVNSGKLYIWYSAVGNLFSIDTSGNVRAAGTITPSVTP